MLERRDPAPDAVERREVEIGHDRGLGVGGAREHEPPRVDDQRAPAGAVAGRMGADLVGRDHEALVLDRAGAQQHLPVVARGRERERRRDRHAPARRARPGSGTARGSGRRSRCSSRAARRRAAPRRRPRRRRPRRRTRRRRPRRPRRRTCGACGTPRGSRRRRRRGRWCWPLCPARRRARRSTRRRDRSRARARSTCAHEMQPSVERLRARPVICSSVPSTLHFSGSTTSSAPSAAASRTRRSAVSRLRSVSSVALS